MRHEPRTNNKKPHENTKRTVRAKPFSRTTTNGSEFVLQEKAWRQTSVGLTLSASSDSLHSFHSSGQRPRSDQPSSLAINRKEICFLGAAGGAAGSISIYQSIPAHMPSLKSRLLTTAAARRTVVCVCSYIPHQSSQAAPCVESVHETDRPNRHFRSCVKVEVAVLGSPSLIVLLVSVDVKRQ